MKPDYREDELLSLSGIQHFFFCRRQWALIHIEQQWAENVFTIEGKQLHERADDPFFRESRNGVIISRSMPVVSYRLGLTGICDVVEFTPSSEGVNLHGKGKIYQAAPIEYKRGKEKMDECDEIQLCAQAMCLEDMLSTEITSGAIYYAQTRRRIPVAFSDQLRNLVISYAAEMHQYFDRGYTPRVKPSKACKSCSLRDICLPELPASPKSVQKYIQQEIEGSE